MVNITNFKITERLVSPNTDEIICPRCHKKAKKIVSNCSFQLKGGGWAEDGYSSNVGGETDIQSSKFK